MTAQGKHRPQPHELVPFNINPQLWETLQLAAYHLERKGYEVRQLRVTTSAHGTKDAVVLYLSPAPDHGISNARSYSSQSVGKTARRNVENLLAYVEGLPDVCAHVPGGPTVVPSAA